ncbi:MAG: tRNA(1-methyladenosine) methyltransferase-like methyltransferase [Acidimicrobiaceae bacterium]|nr:tRNA(1-methyladenosine) methyltransferase-like methyltransferase [Acidimicrobiaceae bacterium]
MPSPGRGLLEPGERVLLIDPKERRYLIRLEAGGRFQTHSGILEHDDVIGGPAGVEVQARQPGGPEGAGRWFLVLRPTLADLVVKMPRGAQVIYPKDLGAILMAADLFPGARVLEAGVGSGALSMAALRAGCEVVGYELREDFAATARANVAALLGPEAAYRVEERDVYEGIDLTDLDRILLDLPEPWRVLPHAEKALEPGGILLAYLPTINQTAELRAGLEHGAFSGAETIEVLQRSWHIEGRSVRPDHRMVAHTGFLTTARRVLRRAR